jgi:hypothetical protein
MSEQRNSYGFPVLDMKLERARQIAAAARQRDKPCDCLPCRLKEQEESVLRIVRHWSIP